MNKKLHWVFCKLKETPSLSIVVILFLFCFMRVNASPFPPTPEPIIIKGVVVDQESGETLPGVNVIVEGTKSGTISDNKGNFTVKVSSDKSVLKFSYIGYVTQGVKVGSQTNLRIAMVSDAQNMQEIVVVGYGSQKKVSVTGAISTVKATEILKSPSANVTNALIGRTTGLVAVQRSGEPGRDNADIYIRGVASFTGNNSPIVIVDGIERSFSTIDPNEIESFSILKDASATAVYGIRGANGVILVTTKTGVVGKPEITFTVNSAWQNPIRLPELLDAGDWATARNEGSDNSGGLIPRAFTDKDIELYRNGKDPVFHPNIDWYDFMLKKYAPQQQYNVNVRGGTKDTKYFVSLGMLNQDGAYKLGDYFKDFSANPNYKRYNVRANLDFNISKNLSTSVKFSTQIAQSNYGNSATNTLFSTIYSANPIMSSVVYQGKLVGATEGLGWSISNTPPVQMLGYGYDNNYESNMNIDFSSKLKLDDLVKGLSVSAKISYDNYYKQDVFRKKQVPFWNLKRNPAATNFNDSIVPIPVVSSYEGPVGSSSESFSKNRKIYAEGSMNYNREFSGHAVSGLVLAYASRYYSGSNELPFNYLGLVSRVTYSYRSKYFAEANMGYNGSEQFAKGKQFGFMPSFSLGYLISEEKFFPKNNYLSFLKLRGSYGKVGNDKVGGSRFLYLSSDWKGGSSYYLGGLSNLKQDGLIEGSLGNENVTWEVATKMNAAADLKFYKDKISFTVELFKEQRNNILTSFNIPTTFGNTGIVSKYNIGVTENKGYELELNYRDKLPSTGIEFWFNANYSFARNRLIYRDESPQPYPGMMQTGKRINEPIGLLADGLYNTQEEIDDPNRPKSAWESPTNPLQPGDIRYIDVNKDGVINDFDRTSIGNPNMPEIIYGTTLGIQWRGIELSVLFQGAGNTNTYVQINPFNSGMTQALSNTKESWTKERYESGATITRPRLMLFPAGNNYQYSSFYMEDASYIRLKNLELAYTINSKLLKRINVNYVRIFVNGVNLMTWTKLRYFDPETASNSGQTYPMSRVFNVGANIKF